VIFREMFLNGLTLLDLREQGFSFSLSHVAARQEIRDLVRALDLPGIEEAA
jgi:chromosome partitioning protein